MHQPGQRWLRAAIGRGSHTSGEPWRRLGGRQAQSIVVLAFPAWCSPFQPGARLSSLVLRMGRPCSFFEIADSIGAAALGLCSQCGCRRESSPAGCAQSRMLMCDVRTARESERRRRKNAENGVDWCTCYLRRVHAGIQIHVLRVRPRRVWTLPRLLTGSLVSVYLSFLPPIPYSRARGLFGFLRLLPPFLAAKPASYIASW